MATGRRLRVGVVGAGHIAHIAELPSLALREDVELVALVSRRENPGEVMRRWSFQRCFRTVNEMIEGADLDAVFVLTPRGDHAASVEACLRAGVDVFCEKPLASTAVDAHGLADLAAQQRLVLAVGFNRRFAPVYKAAQEVFSESGAAFCVAQKNRAGSEYRATFENAIHMVDLLRWFCGGEVLGVAAEAIAPDRWHEDGLCALVRFSTGNVGTLVAARNSGAWDERLEAHGGGNSVRVEAPERVLITRGGQATVRELGAEMYGWATATETFGFRACVDHFIDRVHDRAEPINSGLEAAKTQDLLEAMLNSAGLPTEELQGEEWSSQAAPRRRDG